MGTKMPTLPKWELKLPKLPASVLQVKKNLGKRGTEVFSPKCPNLKCPKYMRNGKQNADKYTKMETKTAENPDVAPFGFKTTIDYRRKKSKKCPIL